MLKGKLEDGFEYEIEEEALDDMELLEWLVELDRGDGSHLTNVVDTILGKEQKKALYDHCRNENGRVPISKVADCIGEILTAAGNPTKN